MKAAKTLGEEVGPTAAWEALGIPRASFYRWLHPKERRQAPRPTPPRALSALERAQALAVLTSERFVDQAPREVYAALLDEGQYLCSVRTMYRILEREVLVCERRHQLRHPVYTKPQLLATPPNQGWSWDITKLRGPRKGQFYDLYVILEIFSRYVVGWMVAECDSEMLAKRLIEESVAKYPILPGALTVHADRGSSMRSKTVAELLAALRIEQSHSRPHVSNDNPYSESQFKTMKYGAEFPDHFGSLEDAMSFCRRFFAWYHEEHPHSGLALLTPAQVHYGQASQVQAQRQAVLPAAYQAHPKRFVRAVPQPLHLPTAVWINPPQEAPTPSEGAVPETAPSGAGPDKSQVPAGSPQGQRWSRPLTEASGSAAAGTSPTQPSLLGPAPEGALEGGRSDDASPATIPEVNEMLGNQKGGVVQ